MNHDQVETLSRALALGALAGVLGGLITGALMQSLDLRLEYVQFQSQIAAYTATVVVGGLLGAGFGILVRQQSYGVGELLFWGMSYGIAWWVLGDLTLFPLLSRGSFTWDLAAAQRSFPILVGFLIYGSVIGLLLGLIRLRTSTLHPVSAVALGRGAAAGVVAAWILGRLLDTQGHLVQMGAMVAEPLTDQPRLTAWVITLIIGLLAGLLYAVLYPAPVDGAGVAIIRGAAYGFFWWVIGALTLMPLLGGHGLRWPLDMVREEFPTLPGFILFGSLIALFHQWLYRLDRILFAEDLGTARDEGPGTQALLALGRGALAGLVGGGVFTLVMIRIGFLPTVASLVGSSSPRTGLVVHLIIAILIGMSYGLLFRRQSFDLTSALGWGLTYGFIWWIVGALTLMPVLLGSTPQWTLSSVANAFPALVGHLGYGTGLGLSFYIMERRDRPWWLSRSEAEAERISQRKQQILGSSPAIWVLVVMIALTLPVLLGM